MIKYTKEDMRKLAQMSADNSPAAVYLPELEYDPKKLLRLLKKYNLKKDIKHLFEIPLNQIPLLINRGEVSGYLKYRLSIGK